MKKTFVVLVGFFLLLSLYGCVPLLIGGGLAGGLAISKDTARLDIDANFDQAWQATHTTIENRGIINKQDKKIGKIEADVEGSKVTARVKRITTKASRITITARKNLFPNIDLAIEIINRINLSLK